ncbi:retroviral-like aspartic protease [Candidatus Poribacteria bacterium]|nr:retroviral-like aspartic protease [Candidatus Poribacteria bacterium]
MSIIEKTIELVGSKGREKVTGLFDSGSTYSCIDKALAQKLELLTPLPQPLEFETAKKDDKMVVKEAVRLDFHLNGHRFSDEFFVLENLSEELIIGVITMQKWRFKLDFEHDEVIIDPRVTRLRI